MGIVGPTPEGVSTVHGTGKVCGLPQRKGHLPLELSPSLQKEWKRKRARGAPLSCWAVSQWADKDCRRGPEPSLPGAGRRNVSSHRAIPRPSKDIKIGSHQTFDSAPSLQPPVRCSESAHSIQCQLKLFLCQADSGLGHPWDDTPWRGD